MRFESLDYLGVVVQPRRLVHITTVAAERARTPTCTGRRRHLVLVRWKNLAKLSVAPAGRVFVRVICSISERVRRLGMKNAAQFYQTSLPPWAITGPRLMSKRAQPGNQSAELNHTYYTRGPQAGMFRSMFIGKYSWLRGPATANTDGVVHCRSLNQSGLSSLASGHNLAFAQQSLSQLFQHCVQLTRGNGGHDMNLISRG